LKKGLYPLTGEQDLE